MEQKILKKAVVKMKVNVSTYIVQDILTKEAIEMKIPNQGRMNYAKLSTGEQVYLTVSPSTPQSGHYIVEKYISSKLAPQKQQLDEQIKNKA